MATYTGSSDKYSAFALLQLVIDNKEFKEAMSEAHEKLDRYAKKCLYIGQNLETVGRSLVAPLSAATAVFSDFDDKMRRVAAVTGAGSGAMASMTEVAKKLGAATAFTASQVAEGMGSLGMMGFSSGEIKEAISQMMNLSMVTGTELAEASTIAANQLRVFRMDASKTGEVADILAATANGSAQNLTDLGEALKTAAPFAAQAGGTLKDTSAALGVLANMGIRGSIAGTALAKSYKQMADPKIREIMRTAYGVDVTDGAGNLRSMAAIWADLGKRLASMGNAEQIAAITEIFGDRGALGGGTLTFNPAAIDAFMAKLEKCGGYAEEAARKVEGGLGGAFRSFSSAAEAVKISVGDALEPLLRSLAHAAAAAMRAFASVVSQFREAVPLFAIVSGGLLAAGAVAKTASVAMSALALVKKLNIARTLDTIKTELWFVSTLVKENIQAHLAAAGNGVLAASFALVKLAALSCGAALKAVWALLLAHPVASLAIAVYGVAKAFKYLQNKAAEAELGRFALEAEGVKKRLDRTRKGNNETYARLDRDARSLSYFAELSKASRLTESQVQECGEALRHLSENGIDLGYSLDEASGKLVKLGTDTRSFKEQLDERKREDLKRQMSMLRSQISRRTRRAAEYVDDAHWYKFNKDVNAKAAEALADEAADLQDRWEQLYEEYNSIGSDDPVKGPDLSKVSQIEQDLLAMKETSLDRELRINEEKKKSAMEVAEAQLKAAEAERDALALGGKDTAKADAIVADLKRRGAAIEASFRENRLKILADATRSAGFTDVDKNMRERDEKRAGDASSRQRTRFLDGLKDANPQAYAAALQSALADIPGRIRKAAELLQQAQKDAQDVYSDGGLNVTEEEKERIGELRKAYEELQGQKDDFSRRLAEMGDGMSQAAKAIDVSPVFSTRALQALMGRDGGVQRQQLRYARDTAENTRRAVEDLDAIRRNADNAGIYFA